MANRMINLVKDYFLASDLRECLDYRMELYNGAFPQRAAPQPFCEKAMLAVASSIPNILIVGGIALSALTRDSKYMFLGVVGEGFRLKSRADLSLDIELERPLLEIWSKLKKANEDLEDSL